MPQNIGALFGVVIEDIFALFVDQTKVHMHTVADIVSKGLGHKCSHFAMLRCDTANHAAQHTALITGANRAVLVN